MWLTYDGNDYELFKTKPEWKKRKQDERAYFYEKGWKLPEHTFCRIGFEKVFPHLKLREGEIQRLKVVPVGRKQKAK